MATNSAESASANGPKIRSCAPHRDLIEIIDDNLEWQFGKDPREGLREVTPEPDAFSKFLELATERPESILAFAKRNGVLGLCKHGLPLCHGNLLPDTGDPFWPNIECDLDCSGSVGIVEPLESWRALARGAVAVLRLNSSLQEPSETQAARDERGQSWRDALWLSAQQYARAGHWDCKAEHELWQLPDLPRIRPFRFFGQIELANVVNEWIECGGIQLRAYWCEDRNQRALELVADARRGPNLFGFIAVQLAQDWAGGKRLARCPCGRLFAAASTASPGRRNFCPDCRKGGKPGNFHMAAYRGRIRDARRMKAEGLTIPQIARKLRRAPELVCRWVT
jgi:hypothetical protein